MGGVARLRGGLSGAAGLSGRARAVLTDSDDPAGHAAACVAGARVALLEGKNERAEGLAERALGLARSVRSPTVSGLALALSGLVAARQGDGDGSSARFSEALEEVGDGTTGALTRIELLFCQSLAERVRREKAAADRHLLEADDRLRKIAETMPEEARATFLTGASPAREIVAGAAALRSPAGDA